MIRSNHYTIQQVGSRVLLLKILISILHLSICGDLLYIYLIKASTVTSFRLLYSKTSLKNYSTKSSGIWELIIYKNSNKQLTGYHHSISYSCLYMSFQKNFISIYLISMKFKLRLIFELPYTFQISSFGTLEHIILNHLFKGYVLSFISFPS